MPSKSYNELMCKITPYVSLHIVTTNNVKRPYLTCNILIGKQEGRSIGNLW